MKKFIVFVFCMLMMIPFLSVSCNIYAQRMASECSSGILGKTGDTDYYRSERCEYCGKFIGANEPPVTSKDGEELETTPEMKKHIMNDHYEEYIKKRDEELGKGEGSGNSESSDGSSDSNDGYGSTSDKGQNIDGYIADIYDVAYALQRLSVDDIDGVIRKMEMNYRYSVYNHQYVTFMTLNDFLVYCYGTRVTTSYKNIGSSCLVMSVESQHVQVIEGRRYLVCKAIAGDDLQSVNHLNYIYIYNFQ